MATEKLANNAGSTLASSISNSATSLSVASAAGFPTSGNFRILIESEILLVTAVSGTTFTVTRGQEGTSAASHSSGVDVDHILTKGALNQLRGDAVITGNWSSRPSNEIDGRIYLANDGPHLSKEENSSWKTFGPIYKSSPIVSSDWFLPAPYAYDAAVSVNHSGGVVCLSSSTGSNSVMSYCYSGSDLIGGQIGSNNYRFTARIYGQGVSSNYIQWGMCWYTPTIDINDVIQGYFVIHGITLLASGQDFYISAKWHSEQDTMTPVNRVHIFDANYSIPFVTAHWGICPCYMRLEVNSSNRIFSISMDAINWFTIHTTTRNDFASPTSPGIFLLTSSGEDAMVCCDSFIVEAI